ncbi:MULTISPECIES: ABC transporter ATP-binding protein [Mycolicibacterium]|uniref:Sulfate/thiosulfate import ATP-binding protein CysA n=1 Tax=Mycolicibacterium mageritense TaxID=53462 RepID=A0AAI8TZ01_MYCME|nr:ATP-binding cassette domain-containing protein [Mycolicibacterium mageritense]MBN3456740.1 ATP-binding cassette domain-containing protein [Mycobacterium sp. DSM 3803]OKH66567.1 nitrate ABC transporter ATP-binding protein [Mycobacterium sp. SWH-M3]TXI62664.1 MAG: ATP-binding cassette domain-containing protein [Mycolicibacterium mageritense]CDO26387.1 sulfate/thiosulfate import ATP-binding protein CysA [Mycolicibacterium mageritense DSM 44476 = CIP 104973]BDY31604.1 Sulfate/thiosulfate import
MGTDTVRITAGVKRFGDATVLAGVDLSISAGEFLAILGRSGSGKSTLLRILAGLETLDSGTVSWIGGGARPQTGVVFQEPLLMPWLTVAANVGYAQRFAAHRDSFDQDYARELMARFGLDRLADRYPDQLSGGQAQRVAILRAIATRPRLLLLDEPFSALDPATRTDLQRWLAGLAAELDITVVLVTHDVDEALLLAHRVLLLGEDGLIRRQWQPDDGRADADSLRQDVLDHYRIPTEAT